MADALLAAAEPPGPDLSDGDSKALQPADDQGCAPSVAPAGEKQKVPRWVPTDEARQRMESVYQQHKFPTLVMREQLSSELGATLRQIQVWFQNRRQRDQRMANDPMMGAMAWTTRHTPQAAIPVTGNPSCPCAYPIARATPGGYSAMGVASGCSSVGMPQPYGGASPGVGGYPPHHAGSLHDLSPAAGQPMAPMAASPHANSHAAAPHHGSASHVPTPAQASPHLGMTTLSPVASAVGAMSPVAPAVGAMPPPHGLPMPSRPPPPPHLATIDPASQGQESSHAAVAAAAAIAAAAAAAGARDSVHAYLRHLSAGQHQAAQLSLALGRVGGTPPTQSQLVPSPGYCGAAGGATSAGVAGAHPDPTSAYAALPRPFAPKGPQGPQAASCCPPTDPSHMGAEESGWFRAPASDQWAQDTRLHRSAVHVAHAAHVVPHDPAHDGRSADYAVDAHAQSTRHPHPQAFGATAHAPPDYADPYAAPRAGVWPGVRDAPQQYTMQHHAAPRVGAPHGLPPPDMRDSTAHHHHLSSLRPTYPRPGTELHAPSQLAPPQQSTHYGGAHSIADATAAANSLLQASTTATEAPHAAQLAGPQAGYLNSSLGIGMSPATTEMTNVVSVQSSPAVCSCNPSPAVPTPPHYLRGNAPLSYSVGAHQGYADPGNGHVACGFVERAGGFVERAPPVAPPIATHGYSVRLGSTGGDMVTDRGNGGHVGEGAAAPAGSVGMEQGGADDIGNDGLLGPLSVDDSLAGLTPLLTPVFSAAIMTEMGSRVEPAGGWTERGGGAQPSASVHEGVSGPGADGGGGDSSRFKRMRRTAPLSGHTPAPGPGS